MHPAANRGIVRNDGISTAEKHLRSRPQCHFLHGIEEPTTIRNKAHVLRNNERLS